MRRGLTASGLLMAASVLQAQSQFEVASVKPATGRIIGSLRGGPGSRTPGQISGAPTLKTLLQEAYGLKDYQISGPVWIESERYEITAKLPDGATKDQVPTMFRALLAERFHLKAHLEKRELPMYALLVGKGGPKFPDVTAKPEAAEDAANWRAGLKFRKGEDGLPELPAGSAPQHSYAAVVGGSDGIRVKLWVRHETMQQLADRLSSQLNRAVTDMTSLAGRYDFTLTWSMESSGGVVPRTNPPPDMIEMGSGPIGVDAGQTLFAALQSQLGLRLEPRKGPVETLVVDRVDKTPTGN